MISFNLQNTVGASFATTPCLRWDQKRRTAGAGWSSAARISQVESASAVHTQLAFAAVKPHKAFSALSGTARHRVVGLAGCGSGNRTGAGSISVVGTYLHVAGGRGLSREKDKQTAVLTEGGQGKTVFLFSQKFIWKNKWVQFVIITYTCLCLPQHLT